MDVVSLAPASEGEFDVVLDEFGELVMGGGDALDGAEDPSPRRLEDAVGVSIDSAVEISSRMFGFVWLRTQVQTAHWEL